MSRLFAVLTAFTLMLGVASELAIGEEASWVSVEQKEAKCALRDFGERPDGDLHGHRVYFGRGLMLRCSFHVSSARFKGSGNHIDGGGMVTGEAPLYRGYNVAFFDAADNLIACDGGDMPNFQEPVKSGWSHSETRLMRIPKGFHHCVDSYKVAYYESDKPIGKLASDEEKEFAVTSTNGNTGETTEKSWPAWKSDGELRSIPFQVHKGSRLLPTDTKENWRAETTEEFCSLRKLTVEDSEEREKQSFPISIGEQLTLKAGCHFFINQDSAIEGWYHFTNPSDKKMFGHLYVAFFDQHGNLVASTDLNVDIEAHATNPSIQFNGKYQSTWSGGLGSSMMPMPIPRDFEKRIASYKITLYESQSPIGEVKDSKGQEK